MSPSSTPGPSPADAFETALAVMERRNGAEKLTTGSGSLDALIGGVEPGGFYLFYGPGEDDALDGFIHRLIFEAVRLSPERETIYVLCGNYRRSRTVVDLDYLISLFVEAGMDVDDGLTRIHMVYAFSERQFMRVPKLVEGIMRDSGDMALVAVQQVAKLFYGEDAVRFEDPAEFTGVVSRLRQLCYEGGAALAATCRPAGRGTVPEEELWATTVLRRSPAGYKAKLPHVAAAEALELQRMKVDAWTPVNYVYVDAGHSNRFRRVRPGGYGGKVDAEKYVELVREAGRSVLMPFDVELDEPGPQPVSLTRFM